MEDGMSMLAVAEGLHPRCPIVQRMSHMQSSSGALNNTERAHLQDEFAQLESEITT